MYLILQFCPVIFRSGSAINASICKIQGTEIIYDLCGIGMDTISCYQGITFYHGLSVFLRYTTRTTQNDQEGNGTNCKSELLLT